MEVRQIIWAEEKLFDEQYKWGNDNDLHKFKLLQM